MALVSQYTKQGVKIGTFETTRFDLNIPVKGTTVQGLVQMGRSNSLTGKAAQWWPVYAMASDLTP